MRSNVGTIITLLYIIKKVKHEATNSCADDGDVGNRR